MAKSPKAVALGNALRRSRMGEGVTLREFAVRIGRDPAMLSRWETGDRIPKPEQAAQILSTLGVAGTQYEEVMSLVHSAGEAYWVATSAAERRQQFSAYLEYEETASTIYAVAPLTVPALLRTTDYAAAAGDDITAHNADRRAVITGPRPVGMVALIGQAVLHQQFGGPTVTAGQLRRLLELTQLPNVALRVVPFGAAWNPLLDGAFHLIESEKLPTAVFIETRRSMLLLHRPDDVQSYRLAVNDTERQSLDPRESARLIWQILQRVEQPSLN
ncbi:helix-turn-helix transcriptional regulator [Actinokineospora sp. NBRC 105648]|uniref:helix-turn-helix domain-containing protein n=1 Tax=Actinokineospora sp. NBRC 105648 TaxID=3032206 RepID=UPI0024A0FF08|nr:helix-turn-helix transcriptional regulator [Actinokineospora sp. NBRC 105648]GLZ43370.1 transcriptional regulator [Actinokineospora sp. NBRC 105648]